MRYFAFIVENIMSVCYSVTPVWTFKFSKVWKHAAKTPQHGRSMAIFSCSLDLVSNRQTSSVEYHADGGSAARYGESFASRCLNLSADGQLTASAGRRFQSGIVRG